MRIICYKSFDNYITHDFPKDDYLGIMEIVEELGIKWYVIVYDEAKDK